MNRLTSFSAIAAESTETLILGSMPGIASLKASQYYAHPRNCFWPIMATIYGFDAKSEYENRVQNVVNNGVAIWFILSTTPEH